MRHVGAQPPRSSTPRDGGRNQTFSDERDTHQRPGEQAGVAQQTGVAEAVQHAIHLRPIAAAADPTESHACRSSRSPRSLAAHAIIRRRSARGHAVTISPEPEFGMSIVVRDVREHELDSVLALNNAAGPAILPLDAARLRRFYDTPNISASPSATATWPASWSVSAPTRDHDSSNFAWFRERYPEFFYIDRIVVASRRRGGGVGRAFYADVQSYAELRYPQLACEVFLEPRHRPGPAVPWQLRLPAKSAST